MNSNSRQRGVTLLELMLAMAVAAVLLMLFIRFWTTVSFAQNVEWVGENVDGVFLGMKHYYQAFCRQQVNASGAEVGGGALDPTNLDLTKSSYVINVGTLLTNQFFDNFHNYNPAVNASLANTYQGFAASFIRIPTSSLTAGNYSTYSCTGVSTTNGNVNCSAVSKAISLNGTSPVSQNAPDLGNTLTATSGSYQWVVQVVVGLNSTYSSDQQIAFCYSVNATCLINTPPSASAASACGSNTCSSGGAYLVFQRPVTALSMTTSDSWASEAYIKSFNQQYTNDTYSLFNNVSMNPSTATSHTPSTATYLCGQ